LTSGNFIAGFSSFGPSALTGHIKPNISAPGEYVLSAIPSGYGYKSGTSMASPHVAGTAALLMSAAPGLRGQVNEVEALLEATASPLVANVTCGGVSGYTIPNNVFGYGLVNAQAAVSEALKAVITATTTLSGAIPAPVEVLFELTASNTSGITLTNAQINAAVPAGLSFDGASDDGAFDGSHIVWVVGDLPPGSSIKVSFWATASRPGTFILSDYRVSYDSMIAPSAGRGRAVAATVPGWRLFLPNVMKAYSVTW
jgi:subtilisin family serine protease